MIKMKQYPFAFMTESTGSLNSNNRWRGQNISGNIREKVTTDCDLSGIIFHSVSTLYWKWPVCLLGMLYVSPSCGLDGKMSNVQLYIILLNGDRKF